MLNSSWTSTKLSIVPELYGTISLFNQSSSLAHLLLFNHAHITSMPLKSSRFSYSVWSDFYNYELKLALKCNAPFVAVWGHLQKIFFACLFQVYVVLVDIGRSGIYLMIYACHTCFFLPSTGEFKQSVRVVVERSKYITLSVTSQVVH